ncbi:PucR family transcriptional regulator [Spongisporangium articulatum]|uniref:PucR family transcriptional regulator n=1 Tax=Spongisporangium articulatum TaxID=3362603 RepID=A0ABW8AN14_9ACTN
MNSGPSSWLDRLSPRDPAAVDDSLLPPGVLTGLVEEVGPRAVAWAVELGQGMAARILEELPTLAVEGVVQEIRTGCESVAVGALATVAGGQPPAWVAAQLLQGPAELVGRGIGMEEMLRSIQVAQSFAARAAVAAVQDVVPEPERFAQTRWVLDLIFGAAEQAAAALSREFAQAQKAWLTSSSAVRQELVREIVAGEPVTPSRSSRTLGYDLSRQHTALILWVEAEEADPRELPRLAEDLLRAQGCTASLVLPVGRRRVWAWGSGLSAPDTTRRDEWPPPPAGVKVAAGLPGRAGVEGFRRSHLEAVEAAAVGERSTSGRRLFRYEDVDVLVLLLQQPELAREFVRRELGALAGPGPATATLRATLKCYLDVERSLTEAAARLQVARNTVSYRVHRAEQLRGLDVAQRRMPLQAALALAAEFDDLVTEGPAT